MIRSLRARLFVGSTAIILLTGAIGGMFAYSWAFGEAIELQDLILIQLASLAQNASFSGGQLLHGVEEDTEVWLVELGKTPRGLADDRQLFNLPDGLQVATWKKQPIRVLLRTRSDGSRFAVAQPTAVRERRNRARCGVSHAASDRRTDSLPDGGHGARHRTLAAADGRAGRRSLFQEAPMT